MALILEHRVHFVPINPCPIMNKANRLLYVVFCVCLGLCVMLTLAAIWMEDIDPVVSKLIGSSLVGFFAAAFALAVNANSRRLHGCKKEDSGGSSEE